MSSSASAHPPKPHPSSPNDADTARPSREGPIPSADNQPTVISNRPPISTNQSSKEDPPRHFEIIKPGTRLGDIELTEHIGGGGMGQVYRGEDKRLGRPVAVKVLSREQSSDAEAVRRFLNEARSAARLNHQNIAQVYFAGESGEHPYIVFEYVQGVNLRAMLEEQGPLMLEEALSYTLQIADALAHAADRRIVHRDVKPSNVLIAPNGQAKLIDLGLARLSEPDAADGDLTASGVTLGTFDYISPEQARDPRNADSRSDIYSLGCTLFYMLTGRPPFPEGTVLQKLLQHQGDAPPDVCQFRPDLPEEVSHVLGKMMAKDPRRRYPDSARLMEALLTLADMIGLHPTGPAQAIWLPPQESRISVLHRQTPWLAPALTLSCLILGMHLLWSPQGPAGDLQEFKLRNRETPRVSATKDSGSSNQPDSQVADDGRASPNEAAFGGRPPTQLMRTSTPPQALDVVTGNISGLNSDTALTAPPLALSYSPAPRSTGLSPPTIAGALAGAASVSPAPPPQTELTSPPKARSISAAPLIVTPSPQDDRQYRSIEAALAANPHANLIELQYDGPAKEKPISVGNRRLTIRSSPDHTPSLIFEPTATDPVLYPCDIILVGNGELVMENIEVTLSIPDRMPSDSWTLVHLVGKGRVAFKSCSLRIENASSTFEAFLRDVAFFRITPEAETFPLTSAAQRAGKPRIDLEDCLACGEASLVRAKGGASFELRWQEGLLAISEAGFLIDGSGRAVDSEQAVEIALEHVTSVTRGPFLDIRLSAHRPHIAPVIVSDKACILDCSSLLAGNVITSSAELFSRLTWNSESSIRQESPSAFSLINASGSRIEDAAMTDWREKASLPESKSRLTWLAVEQDEPLHSQTRADFRPNLTEMDIPAEATPSPGFQNDRIPVPAESLQPASDTEP